MYCEAEQAPDVVQKQLVANSERLERLGVGIDTERPLGGYPIAVQQLVAIARALEDDTQVLVLDEPTASLDATETARLLDIVRELKRQGLAIVFISPTV